MKSPRSRLIWHCLEGSKLTFLTRGKDSPDTLPAHILWVEIATRITTKILYKPEDPDEIGWMIYLKPALTGAEPQYVLDYRCRNSSFPHEGLLDQTFGEEKFEGYRAVGECAAESLFRQGLGDTEPKTVGAWFQNLANNLLPDDDEAFVRRKPEKEPQPDRAATRSARIQF